MKFFELAVGDKFRYEGLLYVKAKEERISCCKVGKNATLWGADDSKVVIKPLADVEKVDNSTHQPIEPPTGHIAPAKSE